jgi:hypothetical protein
MLRSQGASPVRDNQTVSPAIFLPADSSDNLPQSFSSEAPPAESLKKPTATIPTFVASGIVVTDEDRK